MRHVSAVGASRLDTCQVREPSADWVALSPRFTPGWPWPEDSYGLGPMYGDDGWCRACGTPLVDQSGALVVQGSKFPTAEVWMPNWRFDVVCVSGQLAADITERFAVDVGEVHKPRKGPTGVKQILPRQTAQPWHRPDDLSRAARARHGQYNGETTGAFCGQCGRWKWLPVSENDAPIIGNAVVSTSDVISSPETFGSGLNSFRHLLFRRSLGETLLAASPRNWDLIEVKIK